MGPGYGVLERLCPGGRMSRSGFRGLPAPSCFWPTAAVPCHSASRGSSWATPHLERASGLSLFESHRAACRGLRLPAEPSLARLVTGKAIVFARRDVTVGEGL